MKRYGDRETEGYMKRYGDGETEGYMKRHRERERQRDTLSALVSLKVLYWDPFCSSYIQDWACAL